MFQFKREYLGVFHFTTDCESDFDFVVKLESIIAFEKTLKQQGWSSFCKSSNRNLYELFSSTY